MAYRLGTWGGALLALVGMLLLSVNADYSVAPGAGLLQLTGAACWANITCCWWAGWPAATIRSAWPCAVRRVARRQPVAGVDYLNPSAGFGHRSLAGPAILIWRPAWRGARRFTLQVVARKTPIALTRRSPFSAWRRYSPLAGWAVFPRTLSPARLYLGLLAWKCWPANADCAAGLPIYPGAASALWQRCSRKHAGHQN